MTTHNFFLIISSFMLMLLGYSCANIEPKQPVIDFNNPQETLVSLNQSWQKNLIIRN